MESEEPTPGPSEEGKGERGKWEVPLTLVLSLMGRGRNVGGVLRAPMDLEGSRRGLRGGLRSVRRPERRFTTEARRSEKRECCVDLRRRGAADESKQRLFQRSKRRSECVSDSVRSYRPAVTGMMRGLAAQHCRNTPPVSFSVPPW